MTVETAQRGAIRTAMIIKGLLAKAAQKVTIKTKMANRHARRVQTDGMRPQQPRRVALLKKHVLKIASMHLPQAQGQSHAYAQTAKAVVLDSMILDALARKIQSVTTA